MKIHRTALFGAAGIIVAGLGGRAAVTVPNPDYKVEGLVNSADNASGAMAPNTIATLYGTDLAFFTAALGAGDVRGGKIPSELPLSGVRVYVGSTAAGIYYISPTQINFLIPAEIPPRKTTVQVVRQGAAGPEVPITLVAAAPAFYMLDSERVVAQHLDGTVVRTDHPAHRGEIIILYGTGLGQTDPMLRNGEVAKKAQPIALAHDLKILFDGKPIGADDLFYAGTAPAFSGLYQINLRVPKDVGVDPEIRIGVGEQMSPKNIRLVVRGE